MAGADCSLTTKITKTMTGN